LASYLSRDLSAVKNQDTSPVDMILQAGIVEGIVVKQINRIGQITVINVQQQASQLKTIHLGTFFTCRQSADTKIPADAGIFSGKADCRY
jgi:hypothetical protein